MDTQKRGWFYYIKAFFSSRRALSITAVVILVLAIPFTVFLAQQVREVRQRAQQGSITNQPSAPAISYPWQYPKGSSGSTGLPVVAAATRSLLTTIPFSARNCPRKFQGDADCNNQIDLSDVSYWQIDYEKGTTYYADFNNDGKVTLTDYNIWRRNANIAAIPVVQKISQKLGLDRLFAVTLWKISAPIQFTVFAQQATVPTVSDSTLVMSADIYRIINQYTDQSYSVQVNETGNSGGQMTYYTTNGDQIAQVNNYSQDTAVATTRVGNNVISVAQNTDGLVGQTIQDSNGAFRAAQFWPSPQAYARGDFPQAVTLPIANGFTTVSLTPNNGAQITSRNNSGQTTSYTAIRGNSVSIEDYINNSYTVSNGENNRTVYIIGNNLGGQTLYLLENVTVVTTIVTDSNQNMTTITPVGGQYRMVTTNSTNETTEQTVPDPMAVLGVDSPSPAAITASTQQYARTRNSSGTSFTQGFATSGRMPPQIRAVNRLLAIQNAQPVVLGASTTAQEKSVLGDSVLLASHDPRNPNSSPSHPETNPQHTGAITAGLTTAGAAVGDFLGNTFSPPSGNMQPHSPPTSSGRGGASDEPETQGAAGQGTHRSAANDPETAGAGGGGRSNVRSQDPDADAQPGRRDTTNSSDMDLPSGTRPADCGSCTSLPSVPSVPSTTTTAAAYSAAETSEAVAAPSFTSLGTTTSQGTNAYGDLSVTADTGFATGVSVPSGTYSLDPDRGWTDAAGNVVDPQSIPDLGNALQGQADATGLPQTGYNGTEITPSTGSGIGDDTVSVPADTPQSEEARDNKDAGGAATPGGGASSTPGGPSTTDTPQSEEARDNKDAGGAATPGGGASSTSGGGTEPQAAAPVDQPAGGTEPQGGMEASQDSGSYDANSGNSSDRSGGGD